MNSSPARLQSDSLVLAEDLLGAIAAFRRVSRLRRDRPRELQGFSEAQRELVKLVQRQPGLSVAEAGRALRLAPNTVSTLVGELVVAGVLERRIHEDDRRVARLDLDYAFRRKIQRWQDERVVALSAAMDALPAAQRRTVERAVPVLVALVDHLAEAL